LFICDFDSSNLSSIAAELTTLYPGVDIHSRTFDASDEKAVEAVCEEAVEKYGRLDVFYANAGVVGSALTPVTEIAVDTFMWTLKVNVVR
jgi:NADP-dependent 3-hydroxy acid dehydrogenase YdfG